MATNQPDAVLVKSGSANKLTLWLLTAAKALGLSIPFDQANPNG